MGTKILRPTSEETTTYNKVFLILILVGLIVLCVNVKLFLTKLVYVSKINNSTKLCMRVVSQIWTNFFLCGD